MPRARTPEASAKAGQLAAGRREAWKSPGRARPKGSAEALRKPPTSRGKRAGKAAPARFPLVKLLVLMGGMALVGFFVVFVLDTAVTWVGHARLGESTVAALVDKIVDRVLDRDVPRKDDDPPARKPAVVAVKPAARPAAPAPRAELPAPSPDAYAKASRAQQVAGRDPQVEKARARLNELLARHGLP